MKSFTGLDYSDAAASFAASAPQCIRITLADKARLAEASWQLLLADPSVDVMCPCGLRLVRFRDEQQRRWNVRARPNELGNHAEECPVVHGEFSFGDDLGGRVAYLSSMFRRTQFGLPIGVRRRRLNEGTKVWIGDFTHLVNRGLANSSLIALEVHNRLHLTRGLPFENPDYRQQCAQLADFFHSPQMADGATPVEAAAREGAEIYWAVGHTRLVHLLLALSADPRDELLKFREVWNASGRCATLPSFRLSAAVAHDFRGKVWEHNRIIPGPYLVFMSVDRDTKAINQLTVVPLVEHELSQPWLSKESDLEGRFSKYVRQTGYSVGVVKLAVAADLGQLGALWRHATEPTGFLPCRPDFILLGRKGTAIYQVEGSSDHSYRMNVAQTVRALREFLVGTNLIIRSMTAKELAHGNSLLAEEMARIT